MAEDGHVTKKEELAPGDSMMQGFVDGMLDVCDPSVFDDEGGCVVIVNDVGEIDGVGHWCRSTEGGVNVGECGYGWQWEGRVQWYI